MPKSYLYYCHHCSNEFVSPTPPSRNKSGRRFCTHRCFGYWRLASGNMPKRTGPFSEESRQKISKSLLGNTPWNKGKKGVTIPWNKGHTAQTHPSVAAYAATISAAQKGRKRGPLSDEAKRKLGESRKGDKNWAKRPEVREKIRQSIIRLYQERPEVLENRKPSGKNQFTDEMSSLEKVIADALGRAGVGYHHNVRIGRYWADFIIMGRVVIECDGAYWHQDKAKDDRKTQYLMARGYFVYRLAEDRIIADPDWLVQSVLTTYTPFCDTEIDPMIRDGCNS